MKNKVLFISLAILLIFSTNSFAWRFSGSFMKWPTNQTNCTITITKSVTGNETDYIYVADGDTINVYQPQPFALLNHIRLPIKGSEGVYALAYYAATSGGSTSDETLYAACGSGGIYVIDVRDPLNPTISGTSAVDTSTNVTISDEDAGILQSDLNAFDIAIHETMMYVADNDYGIRTYTISGNGTPRSPIDQNLTGVRTESRLMRNVDIFLTQTGTPYVVALTGSEIRYYGLGQGNDIEPGSEMSKKVSTLSGLSTLTVDNTYAYFTDQVNQNLYIFDIKTAVQENREPVIVHPGNQYDDLSFGVPLGFAVDPARYMYLTSFTSKNNDEYGSPSQVSPAGFNIINFQTPSAPTLDSGGNIEIPNLSSITLSANNAYAYSISDGLYKIDITDKASPAADPASPLQTRLNAFNITVAYEFAFITDGEYGFSVINVDNPFHPYFENFLETPGKAYDIYLDPAWSNGFVADGTEGIQRINFSSSGSQNEAGLANPALGNQIPIPAGAPNGSEAISISGTDLSIQPHILAVLKAPDTSQNQLWISEYPTGTSITNTLLNVPEAVSIHAYLSYAFIAAGTQGIKILRLTYEGGNITMPPEEIAIIDEGTYTDVRAICTGGITDGSSSSVGDIPNDSSSGKQFAFAADGPSFHIIELESDASNFTPRLIKTTDISQYGNALDINFSKNSVYILTDNPDNAVLIYDVTDVNNPVFNDSVKTYGAPSGLCVYDIVEADPNSITGQKTIKAAYIAESSGFLSIQEVTNEDENPPQRIFTNDNDMLCLIASAKGVSSYSGLWFFIFGIILSATAIYQLKRSR